MIVIRLFQVVKSSCAVTTVAQSQRVVKNQVMDLERKRGGYDMLVIGCLICLILDDKKSLFWMSAITGVCHYSGAELSSAHWFIPNVRLRFCFPARDSHIISLCGSP